MKSSFAIPLFERFAKERGIEMLVEPVYKYVAQLTLPDGKKRYISTHIDGINGAGATEIARDKTYALYYLAKMGYAVPEGKAFFSRAYANYLGSNQGSHAAWEYALQLGLPVILKPNSKSQGRGVWKIHSRQEFDAATQDLDAWVDIYRIERFCEGRDYRIVVYDNEVVCAYERIPLNICGDGMATVHELLEQKKIDWSKSGRQPDCNFSDSRIGWSLHRNKLSLDSILEKGRMLMLLGNANCSGGGDIRDVTESIHASYCSIAKKCAEDMGLALAGLDILIAGDGITECDSTIIEINAGPGLMHYASLDERCYAQVEAMYRVIFERMITSVQ